VLIELIKRSSLPAALRRHRELLLSLGRLYTQLEAPVGTFGLDTLRASTVGLASTGNVLYSRIEGRLVALGAQRDGIAGQICALLDGAAFDHTPIVVAAAKALIRSGNRLLGIAATLPS
jgi:hypothetical protein